MMAILTALDDAPADASEVAAQLVRDYDLEIEDDADVLGVVNARLGELAALGLIEPA
jgi:hypothetical protein